MEPSQEHERSENVTVWVGALLIFAIPIACIGFGIWVAPYLGWSCS